MAEQEKRDRIEWLLEAYGADRVRWPGHALNALEGLTEQEFQAVSRGHRAFDGLLREAAARASAGPAPELLMARITAAIPAGSGQSGSLVDFDARGADRIRERHTVAPREQWAAVALLAASLVLGIFAGSTEIGRTTAAQVGELAGLQPVGLMQQTSALDEALHLYEDEEIL